MNGRELRRMLIVIALLSIALASGCVGGRAVLIADDSPVRIGPKTMGTVYHHIDGEWKLSSNRATLPEGWYVIPPRFVHPDDWEASGT